MKKYLLLFALSIPMAAAAQSGPIITQDDSTRTLLKNFRHIKSDINIDFETSASARFTAGDFDQLSFKMNRLRLEFKGSINDDVTYHVRQAFTRKHDPNEDNLAVAVELAKVNWAPSEKFDFAAGKLFIEHAGYENYLSALLVREFSDFNNEIDVYHTGLMGTYHFNPDQHLTLQIVNSRPLSDDKVFAYGLPDGMESAKIPLMGTLNWSGWYADRALHFMYSASAAQIAQGKYLYYLQGGHVYEKGPVMAYFDVLYSRGEVDKHQRVTALQGDGIVPVTAQNTHYLTLIADFEYQFNPKLNVWVKGAYETAGVYKENGHFAAGNYMTSWNAQASLEWFPLTEAHGLMIYAHFVYKGYELTDNAEALMAVMPHNQRISLGLVYRIPVL